MAPLQWQNKGGPLCWHAPGQDGTEFLIYNNGGKRDLVHRSYDSGGKNTRGRKQTVHRQQTGLEHDDAAKALAQQWEDQGYSTSNQFHNFSYPAVRKTKKADRAPTREEIDRRQQNQRAEAERKRKFLEEHPDFPVPGTPEARNQRRKEIAEIRKTAPNYARRPQAPRSTPSTLRKPEPVHEAKKAIEEAEKEIR